MTGDIKIMCGDYYISANREGTLVRIPKTTFWRRFWLELRDKFMKWTPEEAVHFAKYGFRR